jgi:predicted RNA-binding protein associated with RNAse of E/G family
MKSDEIKPRNTTTKPGRITAACNSGLTGFCFHPVARLVIQTITEIKTTLFGERKEYNCELLHATATQAVVVYRMPAAYQLEDILLPEGSLSLGYFWQDKPYNAYHWIDAHQNTLALYFNVCDSTRIGAHVIEWRDLVVDVLITPDQRCRVLDEDELPADLDPDLLAYIKTTQASLCAAPLSRLAEYDKLTGKFINRE